MRNAKMLVPLVLVLLASACGPVEWLNPCYKEENLVMDPALGGTWNAPDGESTLRFNAAGDKGYELVYTELQADNVEPETSKFEAHLVRLGTYLFLDLVPEASQVNPGSYKLTLAPSPDATPDQHHLVKVGDGLYASLVDGPQDSQASHEDGACEVRLIQAHWVFRAWVDGSNLRLADLNEDWFKEAVDRGRVHLGFDRIDDGLVLTASTEQLQAFLLEFAKDELAFPENNVLEFRRTE
jgi:hypothetical protein